MECNKDEAARAKEIAERKLMAKDVAGSKKFAMKANNLYPRMDGISQLLATIDVYVFSEKKINGEVDYYGLLGVNPLDSEDAIRKQYRKLVLMLHPDKNNLEGADGAFVLVSQAWDLLSDKSKRSAYEKKISLGGGGSSTPPAHNGFYNSKDGSNMKVPKDNGNFVPSDSHKQKQASSDPFSSGKEKPPTVPPPRKHVSSRKEKSSTVPPPRKHVSSHKGKPPTVPPPQKHEQSAIPPSSYKQKQDNASVLSHKDRQPAVPSSHKHKPNTNPDSSDKQKTAATPSSHKERPQTVPSPHKYEPSTVHASSRKHKPSIPDPPQEPKRTAGFLSRCNGCKMQFVYPRININQSMICPNCYKLVFHVKKAC